MFEKTQPPVRHSSTTNLPLRQQPPADVDDEEEEDKSRNLRLWRSRPCKTAITIVGLVKETKRYAHTRPRLRLQQLQSINWLFSRPTTRRADCPLSFSAACSITGGRRRASPLPTSQDNRGAQGPLARHRRRWWWTLAERVDDAAT